MSPEKIFADVAAIKKVHPENLMARHFDEEYFRSLDGAGQRRLAGIIASGIENPDSQMGAYAMAPDDYDVFAPMLEPMIRAFHAIPDAEEIQQVQDWSAAGASCDLGSIDPRLKEVSMRVRVARNVSIFPLPGAMDRQQRKDFENIAVSAFEELRNDPAFGGAYLSITPGSPYEISPDEYDRRVAAHQMFKDMSSDRFLNVAGISADWPYGRGMYVSSDEDFLVWVGEEDHLRIMAMQRGGDLGAMFERLHTGLERLEHLLPPFAHSPAYGNVTSCPTNLGAGMRASLHMRLPELTSDGSDLARIKSEAERLGLAVRGAGGEHSDAGQGGLVDISPSARLGVTERQIMQRLYDGAAALWALENSA
ncbi:MAG: hypothetical protein ACR2OR_11090 [Hyphomicrobiales bacterium]